MADFPGVILATPSQAALSTFGPMSPVADIGLFLASASAGTAFPSANLGVFHPILVESPCTVYQMAVVVTTQSGNVDVGIYDENGVALVRAGATAVAVAGIQTFNVTDTALKPGLVYMGMACDNTTAAFQATAASGGFTRAQGQVVAISAYSGGLVTPLTFIAPTVNYFPLVMASLVSTL